MLSNVIDLNNTATISRGPHRRNPRLTASCVSSFKDSTDENAQIAGLLQTHFRSYFPGKVLDVGAGTGDICLAAFPNRNAILLDLIDFGDYPSAKRHRRVIADFFDLGLNTQPSCATMLMSHVLQYIDDDYQRLEEVIHLINPQYIVTVTNDNADPVMADILRFANGEIGGINAEANAYSFRGFKLCRTVEFQSTISEQSVESLAERFFAVIFDRSLNPVELQVAATWMNEMLGGARRLSFNQRIQAFSKA